MHDATFAIEHHGAIDTLQLAYAGYLGRYHGNTLRNYEHHLKMFVTWCLEQELHPLTDIKRAHVEFYVRHLIDRGLQPSSVHTAMTPVKGFYDFAHWDEYIDRDPARRVSLPAYRHRKSEPLSTRDLNLFLEVARDTSPRHHALVSLLCLMGLRISEAASLMIEGYTGWQDGSAPTIRFIEKGGAERVSPVPMPVIRALDGVIDNRDSGPIIPSRAGRQLSRSGAAGLVRTVNRRAKESGLNRYVNPHLLRKMAVTIALESNMSIRDVQAFARHADPRTTSRHYDLGNTNGYKHPVHQIAARLAV